MSRLAITRRDRGAGRLGRQRGSVAGPGRSLGPTRASFAIATEAHRRAFADRLRERRIDVDELVAAGELVLLDARETLDAFMEGPNPSPELFAATVGRVFDRVLRSRTYLVVRAYGEMVDVLWKDGNIEGAIELEELWNGLAAKYSFSLLCAYAMGNFFKEAHTESFRRICGTHAHVLPTESFLLAGEHERLRQITLLQQRARALETEVAHRRELEAALRDGLAHRRRMEEAVLRAQRELRDFLEHAVEPMHSLGPDGLVIWANQAECDLLGYPRSEVVGQHVARFHADPPVLADMLRHLSRGEALHEFEARLVRKDGTIRHVLINANVCLEDGQFVHTRCFTRDITFLKQAMAGQATAAPVA